MPQPELKRPGDVRAQLAARFKNQHREWLAGGGSWPLTIGLAPPTEAEAMDRLPETRAWATEWSAWRGPGTVNFETRSWGKIGDHTVPVSVSFATPVDVAAYVGQASRWARAVQRYEHARTRWPAAASAFERCFADMADYAEADWTRLMAVLEWLIDHRNSGLFPRQLPIRGVDTKWLESRMGLVKTLLVAIAGGFEGDLYSGWGLRKLPSTTRLVVLDPALRAAVGDLRYLTVTHEELAALTWRPRAVVIVENQQTALALPDIPGALAVMGLGYFVEVLPRLPWLTSAKVLYWGDIDTHGFAMLARARAYVPQLASVLMDAGTVEVHRDLVVLEDDGKGRPSPERLEAGERACFDDLVAGRWGKGARLEQERIEWGVAMAALLAAAGPAQGAGGQR